MSGHGIIVVNIEAEEELLLLVERNHAMPDHVLYPKRQTVNIPNAQQSPHGPWLRTWPMMDLQ